MWIILLFIFLPFIEFYIGSKVEVAIGPEYTMLIIFITALLGIYLLKTKGLYSFRLARSTSGNGEPPGERILEGLIVFIAAVALILPGFLTDLLGLLLLFPNIRLILKSSIKNWLFDKLSKSRFTFTRRY